MSLISFTLQYLQSTYSYQAEAGMTWSEWCSSEYNTDNYLIDGSTVRNNSRQIQEVTPTSIISDGEVYTLDKWMI